MKRNAVLLALGLAVVGCGPAGGKGRPACDPDEPATICTVAGSGQSGYDGDAPVAAAAARMSLPVDSLMAADGTLYVLDWNNHRVRKLTPGGMLEHVAGRGELGGTLDDPVNSDLNHPTGLLLDAAETTLLVAAWHNSKIRAVDLLTGEIGEACGDGRRAYLGDGGPAATASFDLPTSIAHDGSGNLIILDQANQVIRGVDGAGIVRRIAGICVTDEDSPCAPGQIPTPCGGGSGKFTCGDPATTCSTPCFTGYRGDTTPLGLRMGQPFGQSADPGGRMAFDGEGRLYFADSGNHLIRRITFVGTGGTVEVIAGVEPVNGIPQPGASPDGTEATSALLNRPTDLALDADGTVYFSDVYNHCIRKVTPAGLVFTVAGICGQMGFAGDGGVATQARMKVPYGLELSGTKLYVSDTGNHRIRVVNLP